MVQTRSNANAGIRAPHQGENSATGGRHPPITTVEAEALIQRVGIMAEQFKEVLAVLTPNRKIVVEDVAGGPTGGKAGPTGSQGKKKKVRRSQKKKVTKPNGKAMMEDALSRLDEEDESSSFERMSAFDRLGDPKSKKPWTSAFERLQDTRSDSYYDDYSVNNGPDYYPYHDESPYDTPSRSFGYSPYQDNCGDYYEPHGDQDDYDEQGPMYDDQLDPVIEEILWTEKRILYFDLALVMECSLFEPPYCRDYSLTREEQIKANKDAIQARERFLKTVQEECQLLQTQKDNKQREYWEHMQKMLEDFKKAMEQQEEMEEIVVLEEDEESETESNNVSILEYPQTPSPLYIENKITLAEMIARGTVVMLPESLKSQIVQEVKPSEGPVSEPPSPAAPETLEEPVLLTCVEDTSLEEPVLEKSEPTTDPLDSDTDESDESIDEKIPCDAEPIQSIETITEDSREGHVVIIEPATESQPIEDLESHILSARKGDLRDTLKEKRGESTATSKIGSEERRRTVEDKGAAELWRMYEQLEKRLEAQNPYRQAVFSEVTPFSRRIMSCPLPDNFKTPQIKAYNGTTDPQDHLACFGANVVMYAYPEEIKCRCFLATLEGQACEWFHKLPKGSIDKWSDLAHKFLEHFASSRRQKLPFSHLLNGRPRSGRPSPDRHAPSCTLPRGCAQGAATESSLDLSGDVGQAKYLALEEEDDEPPVRKEKKSGLPVAEGKKRKDYGKGPNPTGYHANRHPVHAVESLPAPPHSRESYGVQDAPKYCEYHRNSTHNTSECVTLKKEMDQLIARGTPPRSERPSSSNQTWRRPAAPTAAITAGEGQDDGRRHLGRDCDDLDEEERQGRRHPGCRFIMRGNTGGDSISSRKKWKNMVYLAEVRRPPLPKRKKKEPLIFTDEDYPPVLSPHRDALVIKREEGRPRAEPAEEVEEVSLDPIKPERKVKVGKTLPLRLKEKLLEVLQAFKVLFAWGPEDMLGVNPKIICHRTLLRSPNAPSRVSKWGVFLGSFQIEFKPRPAIKGQELADFVVECTAREVESSGEEAEGNWWTVYTDGSSATDASGGGVVAISPEGFKAYYSVRFRFKVSNNEAEYEALLCGLRLAASLQAEQIQVRCDSKLIVGHVTGEFEAKDKRMMKYRDTALELLKAFKAYRIEQVSREENVEADILSKLGPDSPDHIKAMTQEEELLEPSISPGQVLVITLKEPDWIDEITMYILDGSLPTDPIAAKVVKRRAPSYTLECGRLYKRSYNGTLLRCLRTDEAQKLMEEIHEGICSAHQGAFTMSRKVTGRPATNYTSVSTAIPFSRWGIDLVGILPRGTGNNTYLVVAIDYFTKWVEAAPVPTITKEQMRKFVSKQILCRFGVPQQIITENGTQFEARGFNEFLQSWGIKHSYAAVGYPQTNGQVENTNRTIVDGLKKKIMECKSTWVEELPYILWTYRTTPRKATGETPFSLTYGFEARAPAETSLLSYRVETFDAQENEENLRAELHLIDERRERAYIRAENNRRQVKSYHDQRVRPRQFRVGDWVLKKREVSRPTDGGKFAKSFEGPYIIKEVLADGTFRLQTPAGGDVQRVWNAANLIKFYQ
ncbi:unnamed protein product [Cuscuta campestris]|uniref:Uncharacterized protein n=1 Tax=Cuscuta campestris TaxID=132261 RepID=A0A484LRV3_9ASTE|nr:unnamed protein product [Cuscuta campestris]